MARKRPTPSAGSAKTQSGESVQRDEHQQERLGPLAVERHVKDDGRALILYAHAEREPA